MHRYVIAMMADEHAGSDVGLLNPDCVLERDEMESIVRYNPQLTPYQEVLWDMHIEHRDAVVKFANGDDIIVIHNGDLTRGNKYTENWVSPRLSDQIMIAFYNLMPWMDLPNTKNVRLSKGTGVHVFGEGSSEIIVTELLRKQYPEKDITVVYHGLLDIDGVSIDYAHHGPHPGSRDWLKGNVAQLYLRDLMMRMLKRGVVPPRLVLRAHFHNYVRVVQVIEWGGIEYESTLVICPSYCGPDDYTIKATRSLDAIVNGMVVCEVIDGHIVTTFPLCETLDLRIKDKL